MNINLLWKWWKEKIDAKEWDKALRIAKIIDMITRRRY